MKKTYEAPTAEKMEFNYRDQVVVASGTCTDSWVNTGVNSCTDGNAHWEKLN